MSLTDHLVELRSRSIISLLTLAVASAICFVFSEPILAYITRYVDNLVFLSPPEAFITSIKVSIFAGVLIALPMILTQFWLFVLPALKKKERLFFLLVIPVSFVLFYAGVAFGFYVVLPAAIRFLVSFGPAELMPMISLRHFVGFMLQMLIPFGLVFELPVVMSLLVRLQLMSVETLQRSRKYVLVLVFICAAIFTPPDIITQLLLAGPLIVLFEFSVLVARFVRPR